MLVCLTLVVLTLAAVILAHVPLHLVSNVVLLKQVVHRLEALDLGLGLKLGLPDLRHGVNVKEVWPLVHLGLAVVVAHAKIGAQVS